MATEPTKKTVTDNMKTNIIYKSVEMVLIMILAENEAWIDISPTLPHFAVPTPIIPTDDQSPMTSPPNLMIFNEDCTINIQNQDEMA
jgi:hypothetical protein